MNGGPLVFCHHYSITLPLGLCEARQVAPVPTANGYRYHHCAIKCKGSDKRKATNEEATKYIKIKQELLKEYSPNNTSVDSDKTHSYTKTSSNNVVNLHRL